MGTVNLYVAYIINPARSSSTPQMLFSNQGLASQEKRIQEYLAAQSEHPTLLKTFIESSDNHQRHRHRWPELESAVTYCLEHKAHLIIAEIRNLTSNDAFAKQILRLIGETRPQDEVSTEFAAEFFCCDQPFIKKDNFMVLVEHAKKQRELHGQLIKAGLSRTTAKSGNPHASDVIVKVNKPKIDNAIVFALMLQPIISSYRSKGYSQRQMVSALNDEGFTAPEGGHWVLSQLQKVLDRIKMNESALTLEKQFIEYKAKELSSFAIAEHLNKLGVPSPKGKAWTDEIVDNVSERIKQLHDIIRFNDFVIELMPILEKYHIDELTEDAFALELQQAGIVVPQEAA
ncbi:MAG: hypothetical protein BGO43_11645 [Gammaproteobacteria bacterium 39-13]|nr:hypothetical protein [Gammaproteobacteria bacterium]OJV85279.1 MAG: hypothetical protein BGO43_11645 [Gammaproteobacteria bacterium 39-13]